MTQPMILTVDLMVQEARVLLSEITASASFYTDADLFVFANEGLYDMCVEGLVFEKFNTLTVVAGTEAYTPQDDWVKTAAVFDASGNALRPINPTDQGRYYSPGGTNLIPLYWYDWAGKIYLKPTALGTGAGAYPYLYYALDVTLVTTFAPVIRAKFHRALIPFICARALMKARQFQDAAVFMADYARMLGLSVDRLVSRFPPAYAVSGIVPQITAKGATPVPQNPLSVSKP